MIAGCYPDKSLDTTRDLGTPQSPSSVKPVRVTTGNKRFFSRMLSPINPSGTVTASANTLSAERALEKQTRKLFEILVRENSRMLSVYLHSCLRDGAAVDDLFQETMVVAWRRIDECDLERPFGPWLRGIASRLVLAHFRKQKSAPVLLNESVLQIIDQQFENISVLAGDTWEDKLVALRECLEALPEHQKEVIQGRYFDNLSAGEVADRLGVTMEACKKRLQRGRLMLARCLKAKGVLSTSGAAS